MVLVVVGRVAAQRCFPADTSIRGIDADDVEIDVVVPKVYTPFAGPLESSSSRVEPTQYDNSGLEHLSTDLTTFRAIMCPQCRAGPGVERYRPGVTEFKMPSPGH